MQDLIAVVSKDANITVVADAAKSAGWTVHKILKNIGILHVSGPTTLNILNVPGIEVAEPNNKKIAL